jgi:putative beta-lysine N-acetyltransferase
LLAYKEDSIVLSLLYAVIFPRYPFPIDDPGFLIQNMEDTFYAIIRDPKSGKILAAASAEMDRTFANAEMTDFAVRPECRGQGLALKLLAWLEDMVREQSICTAYTIARLVQPGMNLTFARSGYRFGGILPNNTWIGDGLESMTVWHKSL